MNRHLLNFMLTLLFALLLFGCTENTAEPEPAPVKPDSIELPEGAASTLYAKAEGGVVTVRFNTSKDWTSTIPDSRQIGNGHFSVQKGVAGANEILFTALPNTTSAERQTTLLVTAGKASMEITIMQPSLNVELPPEEEVRQFLIRLYNATDGPNWRFKERWCSDLPLNQWGSSVKYEGGRLELRLAENYLKGELDLSGCKALTYIKVTHNELTSVNLSDCPMLQTIDFASNKVSKLNIEGCHSLTGLHAGYNLLQHIDLSGHHALRDLYVASNRLSTIDLTDCTVIENIQCYENSLTDIKMPLVRTRLHGIACPGNRLRALDMSGCTQLSLLNCSQNELTQLNLSGCTKLNRLYCYENNLTELDLKDQLKVLSQLYCYSNKLTSLDVRGCRTLTQIHASDNNLTELDLTGCTGARWILCSFNDITDLTIDPKVNMLNILDITATNIGTIDFAYFGGGKICEFYCRATPIRMEIPEIADGFDAFEHDQRFEYLPDGRYVDHGTGWWYPGEPQSGKHERAK